MKATKSMLLLALSFCAFATINSTNDPLQGTWCAGSDGMILTFFAVDSLRVGSVADESVSGDGIYKRTDTTFSATVKNGDVTMEMKYRYRWKGTDTISAQTIHFTVNGDSVQFPKDWIEMTKCSSNK